MNDTTGGKKAGCNCSPEEDLPDADFVLEEMNYKEISKIFHRLT